MMVGSLRLRLLAAASGAIVLALAVAGLGLVLLFERHVERRLGAELDTYLLQIASRVTFGQDGQPVLGGKLADPRFEEAYSGLYWQIHDEASGRDYRSRSLWDTRLDLPADSPALGERHIHDIDGPQHTRLLLHERRLAFATPAGERTLRIAAAIDRADITALRDGFASDVLYSLLLLALVLILAAWAQVAIGLRPLAALRHGLAAVREGRAVRLHVRGPAEVAPLVNEVNALLEAQEDSIRRARDRAADLAHSFKTPLTALLADAGRLRDQGHAAIADEIAHTAVLMRGNIERELTRSRIRNVRSAPAVALGPAVQALLATLKRTPRGESVAFATGIAPDLSARVEQDDLNEILGNLLENAVRHARSQVGVRAGRIAGAIRIDIEDDGPGIAEAERMAVLARGKRLDSSGSGAGLGLAIVSEILDHYGGKLMLGRSDLGGLKVSLDLPAQEP